MENTSSDADNGHVTVGPPVPSSSMLWTSGADPLPEAESPPPPSEPQAPAIMVVDRPRPRANRTRRLRRVVPAKVLMNRIRRSAHRSGRGAGHLVVGTILYCPAADKAQTE
jgi:hypothetical protein